MGYQNKLKFEVEKQKKFQIGSSTRSRVMKTFSIWEKVEKVRQMLWEIKMN